MLTLACGPFFSTAGLWVSLFALLLVKPATYFAFIQAFRYRVSRDIPMPFRQAMGLAAARTLIGAALIATVAGVAAVLSRAGDGWMAVALWGVLCLERLGVWAALGVYAGLRGRRLAGWTISGVLIDLAYDALIGVSLADQWLMHAGILGAVAAFIALLHRIGRRESLRARFRVTPRCARCGYDLTGNLSGRCPECGRAVETAAARAA